GSKVFRVLYDTHEEHDYQCCRPLSNGQRRYDPDAHKCVRNDLAMECGSDDIPEDRIACKQHEAPSDVPGNPLCHLFKETKPLSHNDHEENYYKDEAEKG